MKQVGPLPKTIVLADTVAQRVRQLRELRNMTIRDLAKSTKFGIKRIEEIEAGLETWFSATDRQLLAKALSVEPALIEEVEQRHDQGFNVSYSPIPDRIKSDLSGAILQGTRTLNCPACGEPLKCSIQRGFDINEQPLELAKAHCTRCPFIL